jgi:coenzyme F420 hydrogenase subunit beta
MLRRVSKSHTTARHVEYMQDYTCHITHEDGSIEKVPFFSFPRELFGTNVFAESCMACFDYMNSLADITVGYLAAPLDREKMPQWIIVRTDKGRVLRDLIADELATSAEFTGGDRRPGILMYASKIIPRLANRDAAPVKPGRDVSLKQGREIAEMLYETGPRGLEFASYAVDMHLVRNYHYVKFNYPGLLGTLVPRHVYNILEDYDIPA